MQAEVLRLRSALEDAQRELIKERDLRLQTEKAFKDSELERNRLQVRCQYLILLPS